MESFLATLAPNIGQHADEAIVQGTTQKVKNDAKSATTKNVESGKSSSQDDWQSSPAQDFPASDPILASSQPLFEEEKTALAAIGLVALAMMVLKAAG